MSKRFVVIWFSYLKTDWLVRRNPALKTKALVLAAPDHGRMMVTAANQLAQQEGVTEGMVLADARAMVPALEVVEDIPALETKLLTALARWCIRFSPEVALDLPNGLIIDATGCPHLWGGENAYLHSILTRFENIGYTIRLSMADTIGAAWALAHFGQQASIAAPGQQLQAILSLPPAALRLAPDTIMMLQKLGLRSVNEFLFMPASALRRRFGPSLLLRLNQALGKEEEFIQPVISPAPYEERLPCLEPISTATGIEIGLHQLLNTLCTRLRKEEKGIRQAVFKAYRLDAEVVSLEIGTNRATYNERHLFKLFELKIETMDPGPGIELFTLEAVKVEKAVALQENIWEKKFGLQHAALSELLDRLAVKLEKIKINRYLPAEHYWPEFSMKAVASLEETPATSWKTDLPRPLYLLSPPEYIDVTAPIPDYPPMLFKYRGTLHKIVKADGPERIEQEWWLQEGEHRDYYAVEDEEGARYWVFRSGHYSGPQQTQWFIHGFFA